MIPEVGWMPRPCGRPEALYVGDTSEASTVMIGKLPVAGRVGLVAGVRDADVVTVHENDWLAASCRGSWNRVTL